MMARTLAAIMRFNEGPIAFIRRVGPVRTSGFASRFGVTEDEALRRLAALRSEGWLASRWVPRDSGGVGGFDLEWKVIR